MFSLIKVCACTTRNCGVSKGLLRIKLSNESVPIITCDCDLKKLFPSNPLIVLTEDKKSLICFNIFCCVNKCPSLLLSQDVSFKTGCFPLY